MGPLHSGICGQHLKVLAAKVLVARYRVLRALGDAIEKRTVDGHQVADNMVYRSKYPRVVIAS